MLDIGNDTVCNEVICSTDFSPHRSHLWYGLQSALQTIRFNLGTRYHSCSRAKELCRVSSIIRVSGVGVPNRLTITAVTVS